ncbi:MAG: hypothetical protein NXH90_16445 [Flavobacteriaceae bacterium]|nr:hypothetical protein [Flavobacteriaceae bacterium]
MLASTAEMRQITGRVFLGASPQTPYIDGLSRAVLGRIDDLED